MTTDYNDNEKAVVRITGKAKVYGYAPVKEDAPIAPSSSRASSIMRWVRNRAQRITGKRG